MMPKDDRQKDFKKFKSQRNANALLDLLEAERPHLYDYLMRMTSQISRSAESVTEVYESLSEEILEPLNTLAELRQCLYATARRFTSDIWDADTSRLINPALERDGGDAGPKLAGAASRLKRENQMLDRELRCLAGPEREVVWLHIIGGFTLSEVAQIVNWDDEQVETLYLRAIGTIDAAIEEVCGPAQKALPLLPPHPLPPISSNATVNLSMVMAGLKTKPAPSWPLSRLLLPIGLATLLTAWWITPPAVLKNLINTWLPFLR